jgi:hypothetical protein
MGRGHVGCKATVDRCIEARCVGGFAQVLRAARPADSTASHAHAPRSTCVRRLTRTRTRGRTRTRCRPRTTRLGAAGPRVSRQSSAYTLRTPIVPATRSPTRRVSMEDDGPSFPLPRSHGSTHSGPSTGLREGPYPHRSASTNRAARLGACTDVEPRPLHRGGQGFAPRQVDGGEGNRTPTSAVQRPHAPVITTPPGCSQLRTPARAATAATVAALMSTVSRTSGA